MVVPLDLKNKTKQNIIKIKKFDLLRLVVVKVVEFGVILARKGIEKINEREFSCDYDHDLCFL